MECDQCHSITTSGKRCSRRTCIYAHYCWQHTKQLHGLQIKNSTIPHSGKGLFSTRDFKKGENITDYKGVVKDIEDYAANPSYYGIQINKTEILDGVSTQSSLGRWANSCKLSDKKYCPGNNAKIVVNAKKKTARIKATKNIKTGSEIFVAYGTSFWKQYKAKKP